MFSRRSSRAKKCGKVLESIDTAGKIMGIGGVEKLGACPGKSTGQKRPSFFHRVSAVVFV